MQNLKFSFTRISGNSKTGLIPVSMTARSSCPDNCKLKSNGCYAESGMVRMHWYRLDKAEAGISFSELLSNIRSLPPKQLWRHNAAGDLPGDSKGYICAASLSELTAANKGRRGFTYTHHRVTGEDNTAEANRRILQWANANGFTVNLSANSMHEADKLKTLNIGPVVCMLPEWKQGDDKVYKTPAGNPIIVCPAVTLDNMDCNTCQLCQKVERKSIVGFPVHGVGKKKARAIMLQAI